MADLTAFPDVEVCLIDHVLADLVPDGRTGTSTPANLASALPFIRVNVYGGSDNFITDRSRFDVDVFASTRSAAVALAEQVRQRLIRPGGHVTPAGLVDTVSTDTRPHEVPWADNSSIRRWTAAYSGAARR